MLLQGGPFDTQVMIINPGLLVLVNDTNGIIWSTNTSSTVQNPVAKLLDSGNLVVKDDKNPENFLWESFDDPTDTFLPGMKLGRNFRTGLEVYIRSWKSNSDPGPGDFMYHCDPTGYPHKILKWGGEIRYRSGPWDSDGPSGSGVGQRWIWVDRTEGWSVYLTSPTDNCDIYRACGAYGSCNVENSPVCGCLSKFTPSDPHGWDRGDWSNGCVRRTPLDCENEDGFLRYSGVKLPDTRNSWYNESMNLEECKELCTRNCSCTAYANLDMSRGESGCLVWFGELVDIIDVSQGMEIYIRMASSELVRMNRHFYPGKNNVLSFNNNSQLGKRKREILIVTLSLVIGIVPLSSSLMSYSRKSKKVDNHPDKSHNKNLSYHLFDLSALTKATDNFSINNKLGEGGYGLFISGYMSPEYAVDGLFSVKSDVFSFGVLVLEIISGKRNKGFSHKDHSLNLLGHAWMLYKEQRSLELVDSDLRNSCDLSKVVRSIHIGLLCVQELPEDRPSMSTVVLMLSNEGVLPQAKHPGFFTGRNTLKAENSVSSNTASSINEMTITLLQAR
ncbi:hypothetical protein DH2020_033637 [Rehmannia glutinosa]|uniref:G-type lectin S-receptor-like serine/threonine-protein kinase n=1 Tax=Rehmannia glutinosa TaxID=99300 RepID=A0ABR0VDK4_REHGL